MALLGPTNFYVFGKSSHLQCRSYTIFSITSVKKFPSTSPYTCTFIGLFFEFWENLPPTLSSLSKVLFYYLNNLIWIFQKRLRKKSIILFYFRAATANFWALLHNLVWKFPSNDHYLFSSNSRSLEWPGLIIESLEYFQWDMIDLNNENFNWNEQFGCRSLQEALFNT